MRALKRAGGITGQKKTKTFSSDPIASGDELIRRGCSGWMQLLPLL